MTDLESKGASILGRAIAEFDQNRISAVMIRQFANKAPDQFVSIGMNMLLTGTDTAGYRFLALQLLKVPEVLNRLTDPWHFNLAQALILARQFLKVELTLDIRLARRLPGRNGANGANSDDILEGGAAERVLDLLDGISVGTRVVPVLNHLTNHPDKRISSKAALLVGKRVQSLAWAKRVIAEGGDPRLRANAVEAMWGGNSESTAKFFRECLQDKVNRVVGNAIIGLHLAGASDASDVVMKFAKGSQPEFRMTAAWAMGRIGDPLFIPLLTPLIKDVQPSVRRAALSALHGIRQTERKQTVKEGEPVAEAAPEFPEAITAEVEEVPIPAYVASLSLDGARYKSSPTISR
jgi:hypothetical protein